MNAALQKYATPLTTGLFLVSLISGAALFFHLGGNYFRGMHEWLSMVLAVPFVLHVWKNWRAFITYFQRPPMLIALAASLAAALAFAVPAMTRTEGGRGGYPVFALAQAIEGSKISDVAPIFGHTPQTLSAGLEAAGFKAAVDQTLAQAAQASGKSNREIVAAVIALKKPGGGPLQ